MTDELPIGQRAPSGGGHLEDLAPGDEEKVYAASQWKLMWWKFRKHKLALVSSMVVGVLYLSAALCEFVSPYPLDAIRPEHGYAPPQRVHFFAEDGFHLRPFVYGLDTMRDPETLARVYRDNRSVRCPIYLFERGAPYKFWGLFTADWHLFGVKEGGTLYLLGADALGRDMFSRIVYGARISLTIGFIGVVMSFIIGLTMGCISGFYGGWIDNVIQRIVDVLRCFPTLPLWMALAASLPRTWTPLQVYFGITVVLSLIGWTGLARQVRGKILSLREEDFATAAMLSGASEGRIMWRHLLPSFTSHIIVVMTMAVPHMILGETSLSFLGLGLRPPITSWGVLLKSAQNIQAIELHPWLLTPVFFVIVSVLALNFVGDGLRDAADPYSR
jgi:peptide/nickel transport system permease protein